MNANLSMGRKFRFLVLVTALLLIGQNVMGLSYRHKKRHCQRSTMYPWSVQLVFDDNIENNEYYGMRLSLMKKYNRYSAFRIGLGLGGVKTDYGYRQVYFSDGTFWGYEKQRDFDITGGYINAQFMHYPNPHRGMSLFWGIGPRISLREPDFDKDIVYYSIPPYGDFIEINRDECQRLGIGIEGTVGLEWSLGRNFGLLFEYGFTVENQWLLYEKDYYYDGYDRIVDYGSIDEGVSFEADHIKLGISVHF